MKINDIVKVLDLSKELIKQGFSSIGEITGIDDTYSFFHVRITNSNGDSLVLARWESDLQLIGVFYESADT